MTATDPFQIPWHTHVFSALVSRLPQLWKWLGELETKLLAEDLQEIHIERPIYIAGLARSGSTILLEAIAAQQGIATHQYRDFPGVFTPYWWRGSHDRSSKTMAPRERAHRDGLFVTPNSPEAMEEMLWMAFFPNAHNSDVSHVLGPEVHHPQFEKFYTDHIRKLLLASGGQRYASKENYNVTRLRYLRKHMQDARIVIPIRHPVGQVASLMKQHRLFCEGERRHPRALAHMQRVGHFEFGLDLRLIHVGDDTVISDIRALFERGEHIRGWARYWAAIYGFINDQLATDHSLRESVLVVRYEDLCQKPQETLATILDHCELDDTNGCEQFASKVRAPDYYSPTFSDAETKAILDEVGAVAAEFDYE